MKEKLESLFKQYSVSNISCDSRNIKPGDAFFAIKGKEFDGNIYIQEALAKNASIVFTDNSDNIAGKVFYIENIRLVLAISAGMIYHKIPKNLMAVTGTNGKSSVVSYIYQILKSIGMTGASIGTIGIESTEKIKESFLNSLPSNLTTYDPVNFRRILNEFVDSNIDNVAFEASSQGIHQQRLGDIKIKTAGFTSFSQDHLDYHHNMEDYLRSKLQLFVDNLEEGGELVMSTEILDLSYSNLIKKFLEEKKIKYSLVGTNGDIKINRVELSLKGTKVDFEYAGDNFQFYTNIIGSYQVINLLIAAKMVANIGVDFKQIANILGKVKNVRGRLERVGKIDDKFQIFVDYSHTPGALESSLLELRKIKDKKGKLYVLFGCGGNRDSSKRILMGQIACKLADYVVITDDNPRHEDPQKIRLDILKGTSHAKEIAGRELAIADAIERLQEGDVLLIAGKGHEDYQIIGNQKLHFSDIEIARKWIKKRDDNLYIKK